MAAKVGVVMPLAMTEAQWMDRIGQLECAEQACGRHAAAIMRLTGWSWYTYYKVVAMRDGIAMPVLDVNPWNRFRPVQHRHCEKCGRPPGYRDGKKLEKFRGKMVCCDCLLSWTDLPEGRDVRHVKYTTKAKRMARILSKE